MFLVDDDRWTVDDGCSSVCKELGREAEQAMFITIGCSVSQSRPISQRDKVERKMNE